MEENFALFFTVCLAWVLIVIAASAIYRTRNGKPIFTRAPDHPVFLESWTSGRCLRSILTRLGGARNCLLVAVTHDALVIRPHFPFTLLFLPEVYGLDWTIPRTAIRRVDVQDELIGRRLVVEFAKSDGKAENVELILRKPEEFREALAK